MRLSPRVRACTNATSRLPAGAIMPLLGTCALAAGLGVGVLYAAANVGASRSPASPPTVVVEAPPAATGERPAASAETAAAPVAQPTAAQPAPRPAAPVEVADAPAPFGAASAVYQPSRPSPLADLPARPLTPTAAASGASFGVEPPAAAGDANLIAQARATDEEPFLGVPTRTATPTPAAAPQNATAGRMAKIAPSSDGLPARLRAQPTTTARIVARVPSGTPIRVLGPAEGARDWLRVSWNGITAYVYGELVR